MYIQDVVPPDVLLQLPGGLQKRQTFDIADRSAEFGNHDIDRFIVGGADYAFLDLISNMGDDLDCPSQIVALALFIQNGPINLAGGDIMISRQILVDKTFVMAQVQIGFGAVVGNEYLAVCWNGFMVPGSTFR